MMTVVHFLASTTSTLVTPTWRVTPMNGYMMNTNVGLYLETSPLIVMQVDQSRLQFANTLYVNRGVNSYLNVSVNLRMIHLNALRLLL